VERDEASPELRELRLIYANAATREMSPFDKAKQAERVTELLYKLKEQGVEFPGRMRDHVAEACQISKSKLSRLKVIQERLYGTLQRQFETGALNESAAYNLARLPKEILASINELVEQREEKHKPLEISGTVAQKLAENIDKYMDQEATCRAHGGDQPCHHRLEQVLKSVASRYDWNMCTPGACCLSCYHCGDCSRACAEAKEKAGKEKAKQEREKANSEAESKKRREGFKSRVIEQCNRLLPLVEAKGLADDVKLNDYYAAATAGQVRQWATGDTGDGTFYGVECVIPFRVENAVQMADLLGCSVDYILGRSEAPSVQPAAAGGWISAETPPDHPCECVVEFDLGEDHQKEQHRDLILCRRKGGEWVWRGTERTIDMPALRWCEVPCAAVPMIEPAAAAGAWISVEDTLPKVGVDVLMLDSDGSLDVDHIDERSGEFFYGNGPSYRVTHWAAIPEKPEGK
jgi:ParB family chromosome partitioning protein